MEKEKIMFQGSHPDSLYRVPSSSGVGTGKLARVLRMLRWPAALMVVCVALAGFVYFLMPDNLNINQEVLNGTNWDPTTAGVGAQAHKNSNKSSKKSPENGKNNTSSQKQGTKMPEIDFYDADSVKTYDTTSYKITVTESNAKRKLPAPPVFPEHITPEVQYGNEKADSDKQRNPKKLDETNNVAADTTLKPHITQKPEKPLAIFVHNDGDITTSTETIVKAETLNDLTNFGEKIITTKMERPVTKSPAYKTPTTSLPLYKELLNPEVIENEPKIVPEIQKFFNSHPAIVDVNFTSGHSKLFGISIEEAEKMRSTTQSSTYNTRVSPTLPTWRDRDDSTTKKYPVNINYDVPQCRSTRLAFCRGVLPYDLAGPAATLDGVELTQLLSQVEYLVATNCSDRIRQFMCALLEPECNPPPYPPKMPCYNLCKSISDSCEGLIPRDLAAAFNCKQYSSSNCVTAKSPCSQREMLCSDSSCIPRDWICDGTPDCANGEDEAKCIICTENEYRCQSGGCIQKQWMCDGYSDCPSGEDEAIDICETYSIHREPGEESAGSAPAPVVQKPQRSHQKIGDNDSSKELLITSDSNNVYRRNFTRKPSLSRLTPYTRPNLQGAYSKSQNTKNGQNETLKQSQINQKKSKDDSVKEESLEDLNIGDLGFFGNPEKERTDNHTEKKTKQRTFGVQPSPKPSVIHLDKSMNKLEKIIDGAALLQRAVEQQQMLESQESNITFVEKDDMIPALLTSLSVYSDHADEDNCFT
ncbi:hypothetical protein ACJJTC_012667 [Scirpophaga incertulas]